MRPKGISELRGASPPQMGRTRPGLGRVGAGNPSLKSMTWRSGNSPYPWYVSKTVGLDRRLAIMTLMSGRAVLFSLAACLAATAVADPAAAVTQHALLDAGYRQMYNLQFEQAHQTFAGWERLHPEDPMGPVSDAAAYLFTEFDRLHILQSEFFVQDEHFYTDRGITPDPGVKQKFMAALDRGASLAARAPNDPNATFA